ncbi:hypothetical protein [Aquabacterium sp.]|uniref:hypothetical protein n=1 Tax=Aquabacterium sp. TaxID=1872578 RepID=UPI0019C4B540|nr:hypothetical protein [Aquabacterium sp.]MBC7701212.1 hypothetical protein [Aquabacterium sp.]
MNPQVSSSRTNVVYRRTQKGQAAAMPSVAPTMNDEHRRLLLLVNGFTPLDALARVCKFQQGPEDMASSLQMSGLIEEARERRHAETMHSPWRTTDQQ